jgi:hypothetical protein
MTPADLPPLAVIFAGESTVRMFAVSAYKILEVDPTRDVARDDLEGSAGGSLPGIT